MIKLPPAEFDRIIRKALDRIPVAFRQAMGNLLVTVEPRPTLELLKELGLAPNAQLLGVYQGVPLTERSVAAPPLYPDRIVLFQESLQAVCHSREELEREVAITVVHEVAHYLGMGEDELTALGYG